MEPFRRLFICVTVTDESLKGDTRRCRRLRSIAAAEHVADRRRDPLKGSENSHHNNSAFMVGPVVNLLFR
jgi:hypothetical protein